MVKVVKFFAYFGFFIISLIYFMPKKNIYYFIETELKKYDVVLSKEQLVDTGYSLNINHATLSMKSIDAAKANQIDIKLYALYNSINVDNIYLSSMAAAFIPLKIQNASVSYSIIDPLNINAKAYGEFGEVNVKVDLLERKLKLILNPSKLMLNKYKNTLKKLKKLKIGVYVYEKNI